MTIHIKKLFIISFLLSVCFGTCLHFVYEWSNYNRIVGLFSPINESPWEHLKLLYVPFTVFTIILYFLSKRNSKKILFGNSIAVSSGLFLILLLYYFLTGAFGVDSIVLDLAVYIIATAITYILCYCFYKNNIFSNNIYGFLIFIFAFLIFSVFTFIPPRFPLFQDGQTKSFGIIHNH